MVKLGQNPSLSAQNVDRWLFSHLFFVLMCAGEQAPYTHQNEKCGQLAVLVYFFRERASCLGGG